MSDNVKRTVYTSPENLSSEPAEAFQELSQNIEILRQIVIAVMTGQDQKGTPSSTASGSPSH